MNRIKIPLTITTSTPKNFTYNVYIGSYSNIVYTGKIFVLPSNSSVKLDLTDILNNYQYKGKGILTPTWSTTYQQYMQPTDNNTVLGNSTDEQHSNTVYVRVYNGSNIIATVSRTVYFHTIPFNVEKGSLSNRSTYFGTMVPRMPKVSTNQLRYGQPTYCTNTSTITWQDDDNTTVATFAGAAGFHITNKPLSNIVSADNIYQDGEKILHLDSCPAPYYLCWLTSNGGFQCQPFLSSSVYSEEHTRNNKVSTDDMDDIANSRITGKWKLKSRNLTDTEYSEMMDIMRSPYLILFVTELDRIIYVNVSDTTLEEKRFIDKKKPVYFDITVVSREDLNNII